MPSGTFEAFVRETVALVEERLRSELPVGAKPFDELSLGYDQGKFFYRWAAGDDGAEIEKIFDEPELAQPPREGRWAEEYDDEDWEAVWGGPIYHLAVVATGAALIAIRDGGRLANGFSVNCHLGVYDDVENVRGDLAPSTCDPFELVDDELKSGAGAPVEALFEEPATLAWVRRLADTRGPLRIAAIERALKQG